MCAILPGLQVLPRLQQLLGCGMLWLASFLSPDVHMAFAWAVPLAPS